MNDDHDWWTNWGPSYGSLAVLAAAVVLAGLRIGGERGQVLQAVAHLFIGGLVVGSILRGWVFGHVIAVVLSLVELGCFLFLPR